MVHIYDVVCPVRQKFAQRNENLEECSSNVKLNL